MGSKAVYFRKQRPAEGDSQKRPANWEGIEGRKKEKRAEDERRSYKRQRKPFEVPG